MSRPSSVRHSRRVEGRLVEVDLAFAEEFAERGYLTDFFVHEYLILLVAIYFETCRIVASVLQSLKTFEQTFEQPLPILFDEERRVCENTAHCCCSDVRIKVNVSKS